jgi:hypothetical protein
MKNLLLLLGLFLTSVFVSAQTCTDIFISEYVEGSGNNKAIEIYNPTDQNIDLSAYQLVRYSNGGTTPNAVQLGGTIMAKDVFVVVLDKRNPTGTGQEIPVSEALQAKADTFLCPIYDVNKMMYFNGNDAVTLEKLGGMEILDIVARVGNPDPENGWTNITDTTITYNSGGEPTQYTIEDYIVGPLFWLSWTKDHTLIRKSDVTEGVIDNPIAFNVAIEWDSIPEDSFDNLGSHNCKCNSLLVSELIEGIDISFYPIPITNKILNIEAKRKIETISIINSSGHVVLSKSFNGVFQTTITTNGLKTGVYFVKVGLENDSIFVKRILIQQ